jgi:hypothetical protein
MYVNRTIPFRTAIPKRGDKTDYGGNAEWHSAHDKGYDAARRGQRDIQEDKQRWKGSLEVEIEQNEDERKCGGHDDHQPLACDLKLFELPAPFQLIPVREFNCQ